MNQIVNNIKFEMHVKNIKKKKKKINLIIRFSKYAVMLIFLVRVNLKHFSLN